tara:strand:+ start:195 stop:584 length:390 start_codon:yes stop_codon:yes gene_type:complete
MKPKGGLTLIIAVGGGKPPSHGHSDKQDKKGCEMIRLPLDALVSELEDGAEVAPGIGDVVVLETVEGEVVAVNEDGTAHVELTTAGGEPIEYVEEAAELDEEAAETDEMDAMGDELMAAAAAQDEEKGL